MSNPLHSRTTSGFALSIATGMAMESVFTPRQAVFDPERVAPPRIEIARYNDCWINVQTLIRNIYNACEKDKVNSVKPQDVFEIAEQEIELIKDLFRNEGMDQVKPIFYLNDYQELFKGPKEVFIQREDRTALQRQARHVFLGAASLLYRQYPEIKLCKLDINGGGKDALMLTHIPADLLSYRRFRTLELLESHTGKVKKQGEWNTKYYSVPDAFMGRLPFCRQLLGLLGDSVLVTPGPIKARKMIMELSKAKNWHPFTTPQKVNADLGTLTDMFLSHMLRQVPVY